MSSDEAIQLTNNDASFFKAYAVQKGYWNDAYINIFASTSSLKEDNPLREHKPPEMSRGCLYLIIIFLSFESFFNFSLFESDRLFCASKRNSISSVTVSFGS
jgi:hypothetical protein